MKTNKLFGLLAGVLAFGSLGLNGVSAQADASDTVTITDATLKAAIVETLELPTDVITENDMKKLTVLETPVNDPALKISDLTGLEYAVNLVELDLDYNKITDLTPIAGLTKLKTLNISYNDGTAEGTEGITDISCLKDLTSLERFSSIGNSGITDFSVVSGFKNLTYLNLSLCGIEDVSFISGLTKLEKLYLAFNDIADIYPLAELLSLKTLALGTNKLADISVVKNFTGLTQLTLENNYVDEFSAVEGLDQLTYLDVSRNFITDEQMVSLMENVEADRVIVGPVAEESKRDEVFTLSVSSKSLAVGSEFVLGVLDNSGNSVEGASFSSTDDTVATVSANGKITAVAEGNCYILVKYNGFVRGVALYIKEGNKDTTSGDGNGSASKGCGGCNGSASLGIVALAPAACVLACLKGKRKNDEEK